jgi:predicted nuclease of predicted toxin-antitoxin system
VKKDAVSSSEDTLLSQKIYLDDCAYAKELVRLLENAGHQVTTPRQAETTGKDDAAHFRYAIANGLILLTKNPDDFLELHQQSSQHPGILLVYQDNDRDRDMSQADIVRAIANLEQAKVAIAGSCHILNAWRY